MGDSAAGMTPGTELAGGRAVTGGARNIGRRDLPARSPRAAPR